ncbi:tyrosinase family protein [Microbacterium sp. BWT-B31]|uniref:tyrosinase family protein n=1 Tax=Microbacterium sp. BWT-B31 TaxID=3232072 RepID=UPI00352788FF
MVFDTEGDAVVRIRREVHALGPGWPDTLVWYAKAVRALRARPMSDPTSWLFLAAMHGIDPQLWADADYIDGSTAPPTQAVQRTYWWQCQHQSWYFLPWHRGYLSAFEQIVKDAVVDLGGPADWALPYWNYSAPAAGARVLPSAFSDDEMPDGSDNPLKVERRFGDGTVPITIPRRLVALGALDEDDYTAGRQGIPPGFGGPQTLFNHSGGTSGAVESLPHNQVHGAIGGAGGLMSNPNTAGLDPIFWLHHANIDRLWSVWRREGADPQDDTWLKGPVARAFVAPKVDGTEWRFAARDVLDTRAAPLDYVYDDEVAPAPPAAPAPRRRTRRIGVFAAAGGQVRAEGAAPDEGADMGQDRTPELIGASDRDVPVQGATDVPVRLDESGVRNLRRGLRRREGFGLDEASEPPRVFLKLEGIQGTDDAANYDVYVGRPGGLDDVAGGKAFGAVDDEDDERLAGTVSLFGVTAATDPDGARAGVGISQVIEISEIVDALHLSGEELAELDVRFVPANATVAEMNFSIGRVSVYVLPT